MILSVPLLDSAQGRKGKPITQRWLADQLRPHQIHPRTIWIGDEQAKGYVQEQPCKTVFA